MNYLDKIKSIFLPRAGVAQVISDAPRTDPWAAYRGQFPPALKATNSDPNADDNLVLPIVAQIVDATTSALLGDGIAFDVQGDDDTAAQTYLDEFMARSRQSHTLKKAAMNGAVIGHIFLKLIIDAGGKPVRFQCINSQSVTVETDPRDMDRAVAFTISWEAYNTSTRRTDKFREITRANHGDQWTITEESDEGSRGAWRETSRTDWPFVYPPIFDAQNLPNATGYWGSADITRAIIGQNQAVNTVLSMCARLLRNHAHPKIILSGMGDKEFKWDTTGALQLAEGATAEQLEASGAGASALLDLAKHLQSSLHLTSRTPEIVSGKLESTGNLSGVALAILFRPLIEKIGEKRLLMGEMLETLCQHVLSLGGFEGRTVKIVWPEVVPISETEQRANAQVDLQMGIRSRENVAKSLGFDYETEYETEQEQIAQEGANAGGAILNALNAGN